MLFEIKTIYEEADFAAFQRAKNRMDKYNWIAGILVKVSCFITAVVLIPTLFYGMYRMLTWGKNFFLSTAGGLLLCFMLLAPFSLIVTSITKVSRILWRSYADRVEESTLTFEEGGYTAIDSHSQSRCDYSTIKRVIEDELRYYLELYNAKAFFIRKDRFTLGDPEQFRDFIQQKTGKAVTYIKS